MTSPPRDRADAPRERSEPRDFAELTALAQAQPALAPAVALERELLEGERRLQRRLGTPWLDVTNETLQARLAAGQRLIDWAQLTIEWPEFRLRLRQVIDVLRRHDILDRADHERLQALDRDATLPDHIGRWYEAAGADGGDASSDVFTLTLRPFLARAAEVVQQRVPTDGWAKGSCPMCAAAPVFAVLPPGGGRQLVCGRCLARWAFDPRTCPFCLTAGDQRVFAAQQGTYQVAACVACKRYVKAIDVRRAGRPLILAVDTVATLPLDQAIADQGFANG